MMLQSNYIMCVCIETFTLAITKPPIRGITTELFFRVFMEMAGIDEPVAVLSLD